MMIINHKVRKNKIISCLVLCLAGLLCTSVQAAQVIPLDRIIAVVNGHTITQYQFDKSFQRVVSQLKDKVRTMNHNQLKYQVMQQLINQEVQWQYAKQQAPVSDQQVKQALKNIIHLRYQDRLDEFERDLVKRHITRTEYEQSLKKDLMIDRFLKQTLGQKIHITQTDIEKSWAKYLTEQQQKTTFHLRDIFLPLKPSEHVSDRYMQQFKQVAQQVAQRIHLAQQKKLPDSLSTPYGSQSILVYDLGPRHLNDLPSVFAKKVVDMQVGQVSSPMRTGNGYHLLYMLGKKSPPLQHRLKKEQMYQWLWQKEFFKQFPLWIQKLRERTYIKIIHAPYTT